MFIGAKLIKELFGFIPKNVMLYEYIFKVI